MKLFFRAWLVCLVFNAIGNRVIGQPISVTNLKENKKIDELMHRVLKDEPASGRVEKSVLLDSCFFLQIFDWDGGKNYSFQIIPASKNAINFIVNGYEDKKEKYGFFTYKRNFVLVWCNKDLSEFFSATANTRSFKFIFHTTFSKETEKSLQQYTMHYKMTNGLISVEGGPPPISPQ